jgi:phosphoglycerol transferase MdoB-like AlkP superfamily enzyme
MTKSAKKLAKQLLTLVCDQHLVLFFIATTGIKLAFFNTYVIRVIRPTDQYNFGIIFGFLSVAIILSPLYFSRKNKNRRVTLLVALISTLLLIDTVYFSYYYALPTAGIVSSIGQIKSVGPAVWELLHLSLLLYYADIALVMIFRKPIGLYFERIRDKYDLPQFSNKPSWTVTIVTIIAFWLAVLPAGIGKISDFMNKGYDTIKTTQYYGVIMAHTIDIIRFIEEQTTILSKAQKELIVDWVSANKPTQITSDLNGIAKGKNVILVQIESLGAFAIDQTINNQEITPTLNGLEKTSHFYPNDRFVIGGGHTADTDFVSNSSYFPLDNAAVFTRYGRDDFTGLPKLMTANGYSAYAYHGYHRNFWNRDVSLSSLGYQKFYAADNYPQGAKINMGLNDGDFFDKTAEYIKEQPKPSLSYVITLSSHNPFWLDHEYEGLDINTKDYPSQVGGYLECINYTDRMLGKFFDKLKKYNLYDDSLIIIYGDHTPILPAFEAGTIKYDPNSVQQKEVPLFIKLPNQTKGETHPNEGTHLNIMPTVLDLVGIKTHQLMFGQSFFTRDSKALQVCTDQIATFPSTDDCQSMLTDEKTKSSEIIRYNLFDLLPK